ncbi:hypothetical protein ADL22_30210 [Streptomyces sp. NRRL F-4489]|uniref:GerMN domain-containing protein n=1 Tax=Streptomyces sp. NRRL F-4489 TaxID=1609095 RepID=UPI000745FC18|nr:GerMN domain-containing protein [Streptomyces sp. NRRL F-4489]KUL34337.1 hypothetical protein ADL22_30210 [Streptomyces sp. NRRL F-4489]
MTTRRTTKRGTAARRTTARLAAPAALAGALAVALGVALAGCGIEPTDVIDAGEPASGLRAPGKPTPADVQLYFYGPEGLHPATRRAKEPLDPQAAIDLLAEGPNHAERMRGLSSVLPKFPAPLTATTGPGRVVINLPVNAKLLDPASLNQLVCTAANARVPGDKPPGQVTVTLIGDGVRVGPMVCGGNNAFPLVQPTPTGPGDTGGGGGGNGGTGGTSGGD